MLFVVGCAYNEPADQQAVAPSGDAAVDDGLESAFDDLDSVAEELADDELDALGEEFAF